MLILSSSVRFMCWIIHISKALLIIVKQQKKNQKKAHKELFFELFGLPRIVSRTSQPSKRPASEAIEKELNWNGK